MPNITEWEFTADVANWITEILLKNPDLPFSKVKCEQRGTGSNKRRDLTLLDRNQCIVLTGEVKLPYRKDGGSPFNAIVQKDARGKANRAGAPFFFTWNVNTFVLWETLPAKVSWREQNYRSWELTQVHRESHLELPMTIHSILDWLPKFLHEFAQILRGAVALGTKSPDEKFIEALESSLRIPILQNIEKLAELYEKPKFKSELDKWMRDEQGWVIYDNSEAIRENLERASMFACYALVNKLVFHEALLKRYGARMDKLSVPEHIETGDALRRHLEKYFAEAKNITGDYETVFGEDHTAIGSRIPFYSDQAVPHWRDLINQIHRFDFSKLDYEVIGSIFERLIAPEERNKYGQFYTRVEVVDLINSFCIRNGDEKVMDPACGGGTFLVRAYARKREILPARKHSELLSDLYGVDISHFATHLTTINLATRDLIDDENYPQIVRNDFFNIESGKKFVTLPRRAKVKGLGKMQHREVELPSIDAVVGNPPYIRQEEIPKSSKGRKNSSEAGTKEYYSALVRSEIGAVLSGRSDIHCYFWPHAASFLKDEGYLCLLTSSQWLDVEYGFRLQAWLLRNFEIIAIFESVDEPWFVGARVVTAATILRRQRDEGKRMGNVVRFVQLRRPIREILANDETTAGAMQAADQFRDEIMSLTSNASNERYRIRLVNQGQLWREGVGVGVIMRESAEEDEMGEDEAQKGDYYGSKWGVFLRAPDIWFQLLDDFGSRFVRLGKVADIRRGITSGKDDFFFPKDCSRECLETGKDPTDFLDTYGIPRDKIKSGKVKIVRCGDDLGEIMPVESRYLEPEIHSLMEIGSYVVAAEDCSRMVLLVPSKSEKLKETYAKKYIEWGEARGFHKAPTCVSRATEKQEWFDLIRHRRPDIILPKIQQYRLMAPLNPSKLHLSSSLMGIFDTSPNMIQPLCGILNSTLTVLSRIQFARTLGNEGNTQLDVYSANMMLIPWFDDPESQSVMSLIGNVFESMSKRKALAFLSERRLRRMSYTQAGKRKELDDLSDVCELDMSDRRELDDAVFQMLGVKSKRERNKLIDELYGYLREYFEQIRQKEEKAIENKKSAKRRGPAKPGDIALQILAEIKDNRPYLLKQYDPDFIDKSKPFDTYELPAEGKAELHSDMFSANGTKFTKGRKNIALVATKGRYQDKLLVALAESGTRGLVRVPHEAKECRRVQENFERFLREREKTIMELIEARTSDEDMQEKMYVALIPLINSAE